MLKRTRASYRSIFIFIPFAVTVFSLIGCGRGCGESASRPSAEAIEALAQALEEGRDAGSAENIATLFDHRSLLSRAAKGLQITEEEFERELATLNSDALIHGLPAQIANLTGNAGRLRHIGPYTIDGTQYERFRITLAAGGFEYILFLVSATEDGHAIITDVFSMTRGEPTSAILRRDIIEHLARDDKPRRRGFTSDDRLYAEHLEVFEEAQSLARENDLKGALDRLNSLPERIRDARWLFFIRTGLAQGAGEETAAKTLDALAQKYPNDPAALIHLVDGYMGLDRAEDALSTLEKVQKTPANEPYLDFLRGNILIALDRKAEARESIASYLESEPEDAQAHFISTQLALEEEDYASVAAGLTALFELVGLTVDESDEPRFEAFFASEESAPYREAIKDAPPRPKRPATPHGDGHDHGHDHVH